MILRPPHPVAFSDSAAFHPLSHDEALRLEVRVASAVGWTAYGVHS